MGTTDKQIEEKQKSQNEVRNLFITQNALHKVETKFNKKISGNQYKENKNYYIYHYFHKITIDQLRKEIYIINFYYKQYSEYLQQ